MNRNQQVEFASYCRSFLGEYGTTPAQAVEMQRLAKRLRRAYEAMHDGEKFVADEAANNRASNTFKAICALAHEAGFRVRDLRKPAAGTIELDAIRHHPGPGVGDTSPYAFIVPDWL